MSSPSRSKIQKPQSISTASNVTNKSWSCTSIICLVILTNVLTSAAWILFFRQEAFPLVTLQSEFSKWLQHAPSMASAQDSTMPAAVAVSAVSLSDLPDDHIDQEGQSTTLESLSSKKNVMKSHRAKEKFPKSEPEEDLTSAVPGQGKAVQTSIDRQSPQQIAPVETMPAGGTSNGIATSQSFTRPAYVAPALTDAVLAKYTAVLPSQRQPVLGTIPTNGSQPLFGFSHKGEDAIFALATNYPKLFYQRFVGSVRKSGYEGDIVLAVSPVEKMKPGVFDYLKKTRVLAYPFEVDCVGIDNCKFKDNFLGYPDPRPMRTFANIRYALYEYWLTHYHFASYILILDFRDTFFQVDPFLSFGPFAKRRPTYDLQLFEENSKVKNIGKCKFNSLWIGRCFGKPALKELKDYPVLCSGSTLGSYIAITHYLTTMLTSMDRVKCWLKGIESDQGYQNYLFYKGYFNVDGLGDAVAHPQGVGVVNTIGAMNGFRVPKNETGPLDTFWKIRDSEGYILNYDGTRSSCIHQWDRWYVELRKFIDTKTF